MLSFAERGEYIHAFDCTCIEYLAGYTRQSPGCVWGELRHPEDKFLLLWGTRVEVDIASFRTFGRLGYVNALTVQK